MIVRKKYRRIVCVLLFFSLLALIFCGWAVIRSMIPDQLQVESTEEMPDIFHNALDAWVISELVTNASEESAVIEAADQAGENLTAALPGSSISANGAGSYEISYSLFGKIPLKTVSVEVAERKSVYAGGTPIGIYLETDGVFVVDTGAIMTGDGGSCCPAENIVQSGDYIKAVNGETVSTKEELIACVETSGGEPLVLDVERQDENISLRIVPVKDSTGTYKAGIWVRNNTQGIGTLTYVDEDGNFGALGHGISDVDTGGLLEIQGGTLYSADVISVVKGAEGAPGELSGIIHYSDGYKIGTIRENSKNGIYGRVSGFSLLGQDMKLYETALKQEVEEGAATILCTINDSCQEYEVEITEVRLNGSDVNKGMVIRVTDSGLLELTGGIVQGMSGSPILQNGRIVGAVTHVFVNDPTKGYGIFIENMLGN